MDAMLSIGEMARGAGVSRRQLRHWEAVGLVTPDSVDEFTGYRSYAPSQCWRVRAIAALRNLGFGLAAIAALLDSRADAPGLVEVLRRREAELVEQIDDASTALTEVRTRLAALTEGADLIMNTLELRPLPTLRMRGVSATVRDESEIGGAVAILLPQLREVVGPLRSPYEGLVFLYDGTSADAIVVSVGVPGLETTSDVDAAAAPEVTVVVAEAVGAGVSVTFDTAPPHVGDAWAALDAQLEHRGQQTTGVHRQVVGQGGRVSLQAPVRSLC